jgi:uncharacterized protein (TIGR01244 family)
MLLTTLLLVTFLQQAPEKTTLPGAKNVTRVDAALMCGGATGDEAFPALKKEGFSSVINLRLPDEPGVNIQASRAAAEAAGLRYVHVPVRGANPEPASVDAFLAAVQDRGNQPMYIHCASANRVAAMWLIKRVVVDGWTVERATGEANAIGLTSEPLRKFAVEYASTHRKK